MCLTSRRTSNNITSWRILVLLISKIEKNCIGRFKQISLTGRSNQKSEVLIYNYSKGKEKKTHLPQVKRQSTTILQTKGSIKANSAHQEFSLISRMTGVSHQDLDDLLG